MKLLDTADKPLQGLPPLWAYQHKDFEAEVNNILKKSKPDQNDPWDNLKDVKAAMLEAATTLVHRKDSGTIPESDALPILIAAQHAMHNNDLPVLARSAEKIRSTHQRIERNA